MSQFLAPIHTWLFNKIKVMEELEQGIVREAKEPVRAYHMTLTERFGSPIGNQTIESVIDPANIHGWLQGQINQSESRQAAFIKHFLENDGSFESLENIYYMTGKRHGITMRSDNQSPADIFQALNNVLLEGMPCDRVNQPMENTSDRFVWHTAVCVHQTNWESQGLPVTHYYQLRAKFTEGFVSAYEGGKYAYTYTNQDGQQVNTIAVK